MVSGLASYWSELEEAGIDVVALLDNPHPHGLPVGETEAYMCVAELAEHLDRCAFERASAAATSGAVAQTAAAERVKGVNALDMNDLLCNVDVCPAVIGGVMVYRQGSHITDTYVTSMTPVLADRLVPLVDRG